MLYKILDSANYLDDVAIQNPNLELINEFFQEFKINYNLKNSKVSDIFTLNTIYDSNYTTKNTVGEIIENIPLNSIDPKLKDKLKNIIKKKEDSEDIEQIINKEYYESRKLLSLSKISLTDSFSISSLTESV